MKFIKSTLVRVYYHRKNEKIFVGRIALKNRKIYFEYDDAFIKLGLELSPLKCPLKKGAQISPDIPFEGLFGLFNDSLPDGWGRLLLDRKLLKIGILSRNLTSLDRLCFVGSGGMGALSYEPENEESQKFKSLNLDYIADEIIQIQENDLSNHYVDELFSLNGSSSGARPKIILKIEEKDWLIKFRSSYDPKDIGAIEYAYYEMAKEAKLECAGAKYFPSKKFSGYFGSTRFDRINGAPLHMHTMSGLLHADHRIPSLDYEEMMKATLYLTKDVRECEKFLKNAVFNVLSNNSDDHAKNFSYLMNESGAWRVSPAYDLTFSFGPGGEHCSTMMGEGKKITEFHLLKCAEVGNISKKSALKIIDEVRSAISRWDEFSKNNGVEKNSQKMVQMGIDEVMKNFKE